MQSKWETIWNMEGGVHSQMIGVTLLFFILSFVCPKDGIAQQSIDSIVHTLRGTDSQEQKPQAEKVSRVTLVVKDLPRTEALQQIADQSGLAVGWSDVQKELTGKVSLTLRNVRLSEALETILQGTGFVAKMSRDGRKIVILREANPGQDSSRSVGIVQGRVVDTATKQALGGVTVTVMGTSLSAVTRNDGGFRIEDVPVGAQSLNVKLLGYQTQTLSLDIRGGRATTVTVLLRQTATSLSEVVTTATGQQRRMEIGNDIVKIDAEKILERAPARSVSDILRYAQVPGMQVLTASGEPGAPTRIRMRGIGSISQNTDPAIIVDGIWVNSDMSSENIKNLATGTQNRIGYGQARAYTTSPLDEIDPAAIESIEILRGPSAASLYGQEAANGVIVITTKRGRPGQTTWSYGYSRDWDHQVRNQFGDWVAFGTRVGGSLVNGCDIALHFTLQCTQDSVMNLQQFGSLLDQTGPAANTQHSLAVRGGVGTINYSISGSYQDRLSTARTVPADLIKLRLLAIPYDRELVRPTGTKSLLLSSSFGFAPRENLSLDLSVNASSTNLRQNGVDLSVAGNFLGYADTLDVLSNEYARVRIDRGGTDNVSIQSGLGIRYSPGGRWNVAGQLGIDREGREDHRKREQRLCVVGACQPMQADDGGLRRAHQTNTVITGRTSASWTLSTHFDRFLSLRPSIGLDFKRNMRQTTSLGLNSVVFGADAGSGNGSGEIRTSDVITAGYYVNTAIALFNRMHFDVGWRMDGGSVIRSNAAKFPFPKLSTSWLVSDEGFFPQNSIVSLLRLRGAMGYAAVHPDAADLYGSYVYRNAYINGQEVVTARLQSIGNNRLVPERSLELEGGVDADLWSDRVQVVFTVAHKILRNAIVTRHLPTSAGAGISANRRENIARVENRSIELAVDTRVIDNDAMEVSLGTSISNINNIVKKLGSRFLSSGNTSLERIEEGYQIGGVWQSPILGYGDIDGNGYIENSEILLGDTTVYMGWNLPKFTAAFRMSIATLSRNLRVSVDAGYQGPRIQRMSYSDNIGLVVVGAPLEQQALSRASLIARGTAMRISDFRIQSASISYNLPRAWTQSLNAKLVSVSFQGSNLGLWTNYSGRDPFVNSTPVGNLITDNGFTLPQPRRYALNIRMEL